MENSLRKSSNDFSAVPLIISPMVEMPIRSQPRNPWRSAICARRRLCHSGVSCVRRPHQPIQQNACRHVMTTTFVAGGRSLGLVLLYMKECAEGSPINHCSSLNVGYSLDPYHHSFSIWRCAAVWYDCMSAGAISPQYVDCIRVRKATLAVLPPHKKCAIITFICRNHGIGIGYGYNCSWYNRRGRDTILKIADLPYRDRGSVDHFLISVFTFSVVTSILWFQDKTWLSDI